MYATGTDSWCMLEEYVKDNYYAINVSYLQLPLLQKNELYF